MPGEAAISILGCAAVAAGDAGTPPPQMLFWTEIVVSFNCLGIPHDMCEGGACKL